MNNDAKVVGLRIRAGRKKLGLSQAEFGQRIGRSETWVSQVERGVRIIDRMTVLEMVADALSIPLAELAPDSAVAAKTERSEAATSITLALASNSALNALVGASMVPISVERLEKAADDAWKYAHASSYDELASLLQRMLPDFETSARVAAGADAERSGVAAARLFHATAGALANMDEPAGAWVAADRAVGFAELAGDALLMAESAFRLALGHQAALRFDLAYQSARTALNALESKFAPSGPEATSVQGALCLQLSVISARQSNASEAYQWLEQARARAAELGEDRNDYQTEFGPTNVLLHEVAVAVELADAGRALRVASEVDASVLSPERQGRLQIDVARAHAQRRQVDQAVAALRAGREVAPELIKASRHVKDVVAALLLGDQATRSDLRELASDLGVTEI